jgi:hypothetical protein
VDQNPRLISSKTPIIVSVVELTPAIPAVGGRSGGVTNMCKYEAVIVDHADIWSMALHAHLGVARDAKGSA